MGKISLLAAAFGLIVLLFVLFGPSGRWSAPVVIRADDNLLQLEIPRESLPEGLSSHTLHVSLVEATNAHRIYTLEPKGIDLEKPITVRYIADLRGDTAPFLLHRSNDKLTSLQNADVVIDREHQKVAISAEIEHLETIVIEQNVLILALGVPNAPDAKPFDVTASLAFTGKNDVLRFKSGSAATLTLSSFRVVESSLAMGEHIEKNAPQPHAGLAAFTAKSSFTCDGPGDKAIDFTVSLVASWELEAGKQDILTGRDTYKVAVRSKPFTCGGG
jgi:hypothetical protein